MQQQPAERLVKMAQVSWLEFDDINKFLEINNCLLQKCMQIQTQPSDPTSTARFMRYAQRLKENLAFLASSAAPERQMQAQVPPLQPLEGMEQLEPLYESLQNSFAKANYVHNQSAAKHQALKTPPSSMQPSPSVHREVGGSNPTSSSSNAGPVGGMNPAAMNNNTGFMRPPPSYASNHFPNAASHEAQNVATDAGAAASSRNLQQQQRMSMNMGPPQVPSQTTSQALQQQQQQQQMYNNGTENVSSLSPSQMQSLMQHYQHQHQQQQQQQAPQHQGWM